MNSITDRAGDKAGILETRLMELRQRFVGGLPERIEAMAETLRRCERLTPRLEEKLDRQFHTLAGTAGTYGLLSIAAMAIDGEDACTEFNGKILSECDRRYLWSLIEELEFAVSSEPVLVIKGDPPGQATLSPSTIKPIGARRGHY